MPEAPPISEDLLAHARALADEVGVNELAFPRTACLQLLDALASAYVVLGGDVYREDESGICPARDNWSCAREPRESALEYALRSVAVARSYIERYREPPDAQTLYVLVIEESRIAGL